MKQKNLKGARMPDESLIRSYGNWTIPTTRGVKGASQKVTVVAIVLLFVALIMFVFQAYASGVIVIIPDLIYFTLAVTKDKHQISLLAKLQERTNWIMRIQSGSTTYESGIIGKTYLGKCLLPGVMDNSDLYTFTDTQSQEFCVIDIKQQKSYATVISVQPNGASLVDQEQINIWVAKHGAWLAQMSNESGLIGVQITVDTAPISNQQLVRDMDTSKGENVSEYGDNWGENVKVTYPGLGGYIKTFITLTFEYPDKKNLNIREVANALAIRIPQYCETLKENGIGSAKPTSPEFLMEFIRTAYDPEIAPAFEEAKANNQKIDQSWKDIGPVRTKTYWDYMEHDSGVSKTWMMTIAPTGNVLSNILWRLLAPNNKIARKRVSLIYKTIDAGESAKIVAEDVVTTSFLATNTKNHRVDARREAAVKLTERTAMEEAMGAGLVNFGVMVTVTGDCDFDKKGANFIVGSLAASSRIYLRPVFGSQDSAFVQNLPLGFMLNRWDQIKEG
jgi:hypothetical protein